MPDSIEAFDQLITEAEARQDWGAVIALIQAKHEHVMAEQQANAEPAPPVDVELLDKQIAEAQQRGDAETMIALEMRKAGR